MVNDLLLDNEVKTWNIQPATDQTMRYASLAVSPGLHTVSHPNPSATFYVSVTAICNGCQSSYVYSARTYFGQGKYYIPSTILLQSFRTVAFRTQISLFTSSRGKQTLLKN